MRKNIFVKFIAGLVALILLTGVGGEMAAYAQSNSCTRLTRTLRTLERNSDYRSFANNRTKANALGDQISKAESSFVRAGCQKLLNAGNRLTRECRTLARRITSGRSDYTKLARRVETGQAIAQQREAVLQNIARFGCGTGSSSSARSTQTTNDAGRRSFLEQLFDTLSGRGESIFGEGFSGFEGMSTYRSVCVRSCDGYYWPVSFSTVSDYLGNDASQCQAQCPGGDVELYYYRNPGETPDDMVSLSGQAYSNLPNAFRYRREYDKTCTCRRETNLGTIEIAEIGGQSRAVIAFADISFPLPMRDPRQVVGAQVQVAEVIHVPLPRPRPDKEGIGSTLIAPTINTADLQIIQSGDKLVRIVGPDTPYVQAAATGS